MFNELFSLVWSVRNSEISSYWSRIIKHLRVKLLPVNFIVLARVVFLLQTDSYLKQSGVCDVEWAEHTHTPTLAVCDWCVCVCVGAGLVLRSGSRCSSGSFSELRMRRTSVVLWQLLAFSSGTIFDILLTSWSQCEPTRLPPEPEPEPEPAAASYHSFDSFVAV